MEEFNFEKLQSFSTEELEKKKIAMDIFTNRERLLLEKKKANDKNISKEIIILITGAIIGLLSSIITNLFNQNSQEKKELLKEQIEFSSKLNSDVDKRQFELFEFSRARRDSGINKNSKAQIDSLGRLIETERSNFNNYFTNYFYRTWELFNKDAAVYFRDSIYQTLHNYDTAVRQIRSADQLWKKIDSMGYLTLEKMKKKME